MDHDRRKISQVDCRVQYDYAPVSARVARLVGNPTQGTMNNRSMHGAIVFCFYCTS